MAVQSDFKNLNPLLNSNTTDVFVDRLMFEPLISADAKGDPVPILVTEVPTIENHGISADGLTITYHLRHDVHWSDGVALTARDVKWSWHAIVDGDNNVVSRHGYDLISAIDTPNPYTVVVHLKQKFAPFVDTFFAESDQPYMIAPAHVLASYTNINQIPFNSAPTVSDGPFKFVKWAHGDHVRLDRNDDFFLGKPHLSQVYIQIVPDEDTAVSLLRTHGIDYIFQASIENYPTIKTVPDVRIVWVNVNGYAYLQFNCSSPGLKDARVRLALSYAVDKDAAHPRKYVRHPDDGDRRHSQLDVGLQSASASDTVRFRTARAALPAAAGTTGHEQSAASRDGDQQLERDAAP